LSKCIKQRAAAKFLTGQNKTPTRIHRRILAFYGEDYCGHKHCASLRNKIGGQWQKYGPERPTAVWKAGQRNEQFEQAEFDELIQDNRGISIPETCRKTLKSMKE
jgi:hypothetical protein